MLVVYTFIAVFILFFIYGILNLFNDTSSKNNSKDEIITPNETISSNELKFNDKITFMKHVINSLEDDTFDREYLNRNKLIYIGENKYKGFKEFFKYDESNPKDLLNKYNIPYLVHRSNNSYIEVHEKFDPKRGCIKYNTTKYIDYLIIPDLYFRLFYIVNYSATDKDDIIVPVSYILNETIDINILNKQSLNLLSSPEFNKHSNTKIDIDWFMGVKPERNDYEYLPECLTVCGYTNYYTITYKNDNSYDRYSEGQRVLLVIVPYHELNLETMENVKRNYNTVFDDYTPSSSMYECYYRTKLINVRKCHPNVYNLIPSAIKNRLLNDTITEKDYLDYIKQQNNLKIGIVDFAELSINEIKASI